jgi:glycosyl transferase family 87
VLDGRSPMGVDDYLYLPVFAVLVAPLAALPVAMGAFLWQLGSWLAILWSAKAVARLVGTERAQPWLAWFCLLGTFRLLDSNLSYGQANGFTLAALLKAISLARNERPTAAGLWVGAAAAFKVLPAALLGSFLLERRWRSTLTGIAVLLGLGWLLPLAVLGPQLTLEAHRDWYDHIVRPYQVGGTALLSAFPYVPGQSLVPVVYHTLADTQVSGSAPAMRANWVNWDPDQVALVVRGLVLAHLAVFAGLVLRDGKRGSPDKLVAHGALAICTVLLVAPLVHRAHMLWVMLPIGLLAARGASSSLFLRSSLALSLGLIGLTSSALIGKPASRWLMAHGVVWLAVEILWVALVVGMARRSLGAEASEHEGSRLLQSPSVTSSPDPDRTAP